MKGKRLYSYSKEYQKKKLYYIIGILEGALIPEVEEVDADEWDLKMINEAKRENDGEEVTLEELKKELGIV